MKPDKTIAWVWAACFAVHMLTYAFTVGFGIGLTASCIGLYLTGRDIHMK